jgi:fluoride exporter
MIWLAIAAGGALGALARHGVKLAFAGQAVFPWWTLVVNTVGGLAIGVLAAAARDWPEPLRAGLIVGLLGGFTTFSAFSLETLQLVRDQPVLAVANVLANVTLALLACALGLWWARGA